MTLKSKLAYLKYGMCHISINFEHFYFGSNLDQRGGKYLTKIIFDIKIEIGIFEIPNVSNFNKSRAFLI